MSNCGTEKVGTSVKFEIGEAGVVLRFSKETLLGFVQMCAKAGTDAVLRLVQSWCRTLLTQSRAAWGLDR